MQIISINTGRPRQVEWRGATVSTAIFKQPVDGPVRVSRLNVEGDGQADLNVHGGVDKAVYAYATGNYDWWRTQLPDTLLDWGHFGENLTIDDFSETAIRVGDVFRAGTVVLQAAQPRMPCYKLGLRFGDPAMIDRFLAANRSGFYMRVLEEGMMQAGDEFVRTETDADNITIAELSRLYADGDASAAALRHAIASTGLAERWRQRFEMRLSRLEHQSSAELHAG